MNAVAERLQQTPVYRLQNASSRRVYNGNFAMEFAIYALPTVLAAGALLALRYGMDSTWLKSGGAALVGFGIGSLISTLFAYNRGQQSQVGRRNVASLVGEEIDVSPVSPVFCRVEGEIVGRGVPGLFWSDDLVLRDETGFITLQYHQPLGIMEFFFGWLKAGRYQGRQAKVYGWYRRAPVPYVEIDRVEIVNAPDDGIRCYYVWGVYAVAAVAIIAGAIMTVW
jgi:heat shock protein HtpX